MTADHEPITTVPNRRRAGMPRAERERLEARRRALLDQLRAADKALAGLAKERRHVLDQLGEVSEALWPRAAWPRGRRPGRDSLAEPLPPLPEAPIWLWGRRLRAVCMRLLVRCGGLPLRQLHALLHLHGFGVASPHPVKALADALGHEADAGTAVREARGRYRASPRYRPPKGGSRLVDLSVPLPDLDD